MPIPELQSVAPANPVPIEHVEPRTEAAARGPSPPSSQSLNFSAAKFKTESGET